MLNNSDAFTASNSGPTPEAPKLPTALQEVLDSIDDLDSLVIVFVKKFVCDSDTELEQELKQKINEHPKQFHYYSICYRPHELQFPQPATDMVYIFKPKAKWFSLFGQAQGFPQHFDSIIENLEKQQQPQAKMPGLLQQAGGLAKTGWDAAKGLVQGNGFMASAEVAETRLNICKGCEHYTENRCTQCGCWMDKKVQIKVSSCPVGKW